MNMKKRLLPLMLALVLCLGLTVPALAAEKEAETYKEVIACETLNVGSFCEGLVWVEAGDGIGFMDKTGKVVISGKYDGVRNFSEGLAAVSKNDKWGFIDQTGKEVISLKYDVAMYFSDGFALVVENGKCGFIDKTGKEAIPCEYDDGRANGFSEGLVGVAKNGKWGFIDKAGKEVIPFEYDGALDFSEGLVGVMKDGKCGYIDKTGKEVVPCQYDSNDNFYEGFAQVKKNDKYGFIDKTGKEVVPCTLDGAGYFSEGLALVLKNNKWGFIDQTGKEVIPCKYDDAWHFSEGFAAVMQNGKWGYIDKTGEVVVPLKYDDAATISDGMARVGIVPELDGDYVNVPPLYGFIAIHGIQEPVTAKVSDWAKEQMDSAAANGLIADGLGDDYTVSITRAQFAAVTVKLYEAMSGEAAPAAGDSPFTDTSDPAVIQAEALGFVGGKGNGKFDPDSPVTREQAALMLSRVYTKLGGEVPAVDATEFADDDAMSDYAKSAIAFMSGKEIVGGVGNNKFDPQGSASIEQALVIALRMIENLK